MAAYSEAASVLAPLLWALATVAVSALVWVSWDTARCIWCLRGVPGPHSWTLDGDVQAHMQPRLHHWVRKWSEDHGPVTHMRILCYSFVLVSDPSLMTPLFRLPRSSIYSPLNIVSLNRPNIFTRPTTDPLWRAVRRAVAHVFMPANLQLHFPAALAHVNRFLVTVCAPAACAASTPGSESGGRETSVDMLQELFRLTMHMLGDVGFEADLTDPKVREEMDDLLQAMALVVTEVSDRATDLPLRPLRLYRADVRQAHLDIVRWHRLMGTFARRTLAAARTAIAEEASSHPASGKAGGHEGLSIVRALLSARTAAGAPLPQDLLLAEVATFFFVGTDTTSNSLSWTLLLLHQHPECKARAVAELEALGLKASGGGAAREMIYSDLAALTYCNACITEALRLEPVVANGTFRDVPKDMRIGGRFVPRGTVVCLPLFAAHTSPSNFPDAHAYQPERWLEGGPNPPTQVVTVNSADERAAANGDKPGKPAAVQGGCPFAGDSAALPQQSFPFSRGDRNCVGRALARMEMTLIVAKLLSAYDVQLADAAISPEHVREAAAYKCTWCPKSLPMRLVPW